MKNIMSRNRRAR